MSNETETAAGAMSDEVRCDAAFKVSESTFGGNYGSGPQERRRPCPLTKDLTIGRFKRKAGDLLCEASPEWINDYDLKEVHPVTWKACLKIADLFKDVA